MCASTRDLVCILDPKDTLSLVARGKQVVEERCPGAPEVQETSRTRGKPHSHAHLLELCKIVRMRKITWIIVGGVWSKRWSWLPTSLLCSRNASFWTVSEPLPHVVRSKQRLICSMRVVAQDFAPWSLGRRWWPIVREKLWWQPRRTLEWKSSTCLPPTVGGQ